MYRKQISGWIDYKGDFYNTSYDGEVCWISVFHVDFKDLDLMNRLKDDGIIKIGDYYDSHFYTYKRKNYTDSEMLLEELLEDKIVERVDGSIEFTINKE